MYYAERQQMKITNNENTVEDAIETDENWRGMEESSRTEYCKLCTSACRPVSVADAEIGLRDLRWLRTTADAAAAAFIGLGLQLAIAMHWLLSQSVLIACLVLVIRWPQPQRWYGR